MERLHESVVQALNQANTDNKDGMDLSFCQIDLDNKMLSFAGARNPLVYMQDGKIEVVEATRRPIGGVYHKALPPFTSFEVSLDKPTWVYLFTDGYQDQFGGEKGRKFYSKNLYKFLEQIHQKPFAEQKNMLAKNFDQWRGTEYQQVDDVSVIGFRIDA